MAELTHQAQLCRTLSCQLQKVREALLLAPETRRELEKDWAAMRAQGADGRCKAMPRLFDFL
jgi:hypothetical protein